MCPPNAGAEPPAGPNPRAVVAVDLCIDAGAVAGARVRGEDGVWVTLHDGAHPLASAEAQLDALGSTPEVLVIVGGGLGYLAEAAVSRWAGTMVVVVEPHEALAAAARRRLPALDTSPRVRMVTGPLYEGAGDLWRVFDSLRDPAAAPPVIADPVLARVWPSLMREAARVAGRALAAARMNAKARAENAGRYVTNTLRNVRHLVAGPDPAALRDRFAGIPAVVVGAGPSLDGCLPALRAVADRALIIATDTAWRPLVRGGITPHLVVALDPTPENGRHLGDVPASPATWIVAEGSVDAAALATLDGRVALFRVASHHPWPWLTSIVDRLQLRAWGSVLTSAFDLALVCACDPVVFVGADLAFTGGQPYCRGTTAETHWASHAARGVSLRQVWANTLASRPLVTTRDVHDAPAASAPHLVEFRDWLVARAAELALGRTINASGAGILHGPGIRQADVTSALASCMPCAAEVRARIDLAFERTADPAPGRAVAAALDAVIGAATPGPPVDAWITFGRPTLAVADVQAAAAAGRRALLAPVAAAPDVPRGPDLRWHLADRAAAARARLSRETAVLDGVVPPPPRSPADARVAAARAIDTLLALPRLVTALGDDLAAGAAPDHIPLFARFQWVPQAAPFVAALEEAQLDGGTPPPAAVPEATEEYWDEPTSVVRLQEPQAGSADDPLDVLARSTLVAEYLDICAPAAATRRDARLLAAARRALATPALIVPARQSFTLALAAGTVRLPLVVDALMRAATGTVAVPDGRAEPRTAFFEAGCASIEPDVLSTHGWARGWSVVTGGPDHAIYVPADANQSLRIDADGGAAPASAWPSPITGEVPWGREGGRLAWHAGTRVVHWCEAVEAPIRSAVAPFKPVHVALAADGSPFWTDASRQLWAWTPGRPARLVATLPVAGIPRFEDHTLIVAPMPRDGDGRVVRTRECYAWRIDAVRGAWTTYATGVEGQIGKVAAVAGWTAATHPCADLVRVSAPDGRAWWLACHAPLGVAWAGTSLVVLADGSTPLRFARLLDRLDGSAAGPLFAQ